MAPLGRSFSCLNLFPHLLYPGSRDSLRGEINERLEGRASGHIGCKSHFNT
jgi:hypothetical protein